MFEIVRRAFFADFVFEDQVIQKKNETQPQIVYFMLKGLNEVERHFYKYTFPDLFGNIEQDEINRYSSVIERYYQFYDDIIGKYLASRKEDELLVVYSPHGIEPLPLWKRVTNTYHKIGGVSLSQREIEKVFTLGCLRGASVPSSNRLPDSQSRLSHSV